MIFDERVALFNQSAEDRDQALKKLAGVFLEKGIVKDTYYDALLLREKNYPTGLRLTHMGVAIPHTDPIHVNRTQVGFISLAKPVIFTEMGTDDAKLEVNMIFMLALKEAHEQLEMLQNLMGMFGNDELMERLRKVSDYEAYYQIIKEAGLDKWKEEKKC